MENISRIKMEKADLYPREARDARVLAIIVCVSVCLSVTLQYCIKTAKHRIMQTTPHDSFLTPKVVGGRPYFS